MPAITLVSYVATMPGATSSRITDLEICDPGDGAGATLYATTRYGGTLSAWDISPTGPTAINAVAHNRGDAAGTAASLGFIDTAGGPAVLTGGGDGGPLTLVQINTNGGLGGLQSLGTLPGFAGDMIGTVTLDLGGGVQAVYGGIAGCSGIGQLTFSSTGSLQASAVIADTATTHADQVVALAEATVGGQQYLFTASGIDAGVTCWAVSGTGELTACTSLGVEEGLWIGTPTALEVAVVGGVTYLVLAAAGSNTLSMIAVGSDGTMYITDYVMDDLGSRFAGATALEVVECGGQSYVIVGGSDDGVSIYQVLPGGQLLALAHLADTTTMGIADVSAIAATGTSDGIDIYVASGSEAGLTQLHFDPGPAGQTLQAAPQGSNLTGGGNNDVLAGGGGGDHLSGGGGNDILMDGAGSDTLTGSAGADTFVITADGLTDTITDFSLGTDHIDLSSWTMLHDVDQLMMTSTSTGLRITFGTEVLVVNSASGGSINPAELTNADLINLSRIPVELPDIPEPVTTITGTSSAEQLTGTDIADTITGDQGNDSLYGNEGNDSLSGGAGNDLSDGGAGYDTLLGDNGNDSLYGGAGNDMLIGTDGLNLLDGGEGNDIYVIDGSDTITEAAGEGIDLVKASVSHTLGANLENLTLTGSGGINGTGNGSANLITGNSGNNVLDGGGGTDTLTGGKGNDTYLTDGGDTITEASGEGTDLVKASVSYTLGANLENLTLTGSGGISGTGNSAANLITGNDASNVLDGGGGTDTLIGGKGNDTYLTDGGDTITEAASEGTDLVKASVSYTLAANLENLTLTGSGGISGTGNSAANLITGNGGNNKLSGMDANDTLDGATGADTLIGGKGNDTYLTDGGDTITEAASEGTDLVKASVSYTLAANLENLTLTGSGGISGTGNSAANLITGNGGNNKLSGMDANDTLDGATGADTLIGGKGNDTYLTDGGDTITEAASEGTDLVKASVSYTLGTNLENLTLTGSGGISGTGNSAANLITGNGGNNKLDGSSGNDTLNGMAGNDTLTGGTGRDSLLGDTGADVFIYRSAAESGAGQAARDVIDGFTHGQDRIDLSAIDANPFQSGNQAFAFIGTGAFGGTGASSAGQLRFVATNGGTASLIEIDINGNGVADMQIYINQTNVMTAADFIL